MKQDPVKFRSTYSDEDGNHQKGFAPFRDQQGNYIYARDVTAEANYYRHGTMITFQIIDRFQHPQMGEQQRVLVSMTYYDKDNHEAKELIENLASQDLRGETASKTAFKLYAKLFLFSKWMKHYLPNVVAFYEKLWQQSNEIPITGNPGFGHDPLTEML